MMRLGPYKKRKSQQSLHHVRAQKAASKLGRKPSPGPDRALTLDWQPLEL